MSDDRETPMSLLSLIIAAEEARREAFELSMLEYERGLDVLDQWEPITVPEEEVCEDNRVNGCPRRITGR